MSEQQQDLVQPAVHGVDDSRAIRATEMPLWWAVLRNPTGGSRPRHIPKAEQSAIALWLADLEAELDHPATPQDHAILGAIGKHKLLEIRLSREVFRSSRTKGGEIKQSVGELRQTTRLIIDMLGKLKFRNGRKRGVVDIRDLWPAHDTEQVDKAKRDQVHSGSSEPITSAPVAREEKGNE